MPKAKKSTSQLLVEVLKPDQKPETQTTKKEAEPCHIGVIPQSTAPSFIEDVNSLGDKAMSYATLIIGESGTGKTCSLRNLDPKKTLLIQPVRKPLPFRSAEWSECVFDKGNLVSGNIIVNSDPQRIMSAMQWSPFDVIVVDDWQYILATMFMNRRKEKGYDKFSDIGGAGFDIASIASQLGGNKRVYIIAHTMTDELGVTRVKTLGKMLDDKIVVEGMFTTVLRTHVENGTYQFSTQNSGNDTVKSPLGMFDQMYIDNDLSAVDQTICEYYGIK